MHAAAKQETPELSAEMFAALVHFQNQSTVIRSTFGAWQGRVSSRIKQINQANSDLTDAKSARGGGDALAPYVERVRYLKAEAFKDKKPPSYDPLPEVERFLHNNPAPKIVVIDHREGDTFEDATAATDNVLREISATVAAPKSDESRVAALEAQINALAETGRPTVDRAGRLVIQDSAIAGTIAPDIARLVAWAVRDQLLAAVAGLVAPLGGVAMTDADRKARLAALNDELTTALRYESAVATEAEKAGQVVERRRHVHPAILVGAVMNPATVADHYFKKRGV